MPQSIYFVIYLFIYLCFMFSYSMVLTTCNPLKSRDRFFFIMAILSHTYYVYEKAEVHLIVINVLNVFRTK
jgi:hypothetical protein